MGVVEFLLAAAEFLLALVKSQFALLEFVLHLQDALVALLNLLFEFRLLVEELFFYFKEFLFLDNVGLACGVVDHAVVLLFQHVAEKAVTDAAAYDQTDEDEYSFVHCFVMNVCWLIGALPGGHCVSQRVCLRFGNTKHGSRGFA